MTRHECRPRADFQDIVQSQGLLYHRNADGSPYWEENAYYAFTSREIDTIYEAAKELHQMLLAAATRVLKKDNGLDDLGIPPSLHDVIRRAWDDDEWEFYGRFDLALDGKGVPKLIEYNADTPTGLLEASAIQWYWKEDKFPKADQFNSIHESLVARWKELIVHGQIKKETMHVTSAGGHVEDRMTAGYLARTAEEAGISTKYLAVGRIGWASKRGEFVDEENQPIRQMFKLYPWEWMGTERFAPQLGLVRWKVLEPPWKAIFASKRLLLSLQELYPDHPLLLRVSDRPLPGAHVKKPVFGREGANVTFYKGSVIADKSDGPYAGEAFIFQEHVSLAQARPGIYAQCGVWMAGPEPVGMGIREDVRPILGNTSPFMPHIIL
jgi:glutathionylspermidine synthase